MTAARTKYEEPHKYAIAAMYHWHNQYARQNGSAMDFWRRLGEREQDFIKRMVAAIEQAAPRTPTPETTDGR